MKYIINDPHLGNNHEGDTKLISNLTVREAIKQKCYDCVGGRHPGEVSKCTSTDCQLYTWRGGRFQKHTGVARRRATVSYCVDYCCNGSQSERTACPSITCPLWPYRMTQTDRTHELKN
jgi:hypothetical protein